MNGDGGGNALFVAEQASLREYLRAWLAHAQASYAWGADAGILLAAPGKLLATGPAPSIRIPVGFWGLLPLSVAAYCSSSRAEHAPRIRRLALACEMLLCALDYFDELEDNDGSQARSTLGDGRLLNCSTALYQEGLQVLVELDDTAEHSSKNRCLLTSIASEELRQAMSGQHLDLLAETRPLNGFDLDECLAIAEAKSGTLCRMACRLATAVVAASDEIAALFAQIGTNIGTAAQLENDIHDFEQALSVAGTAPIDKTDLLRQKKTFPLVLSHLALQQPPASVDTLEYEGQDQNWRLQVYRNAIQQALGGAIVHRLAAASLVENIEQLRGTAFPPQLRLILGIDIDAR
jgi:geranylgeranyl pyrophosphate synthase